MFKLRPLDHPGSSQASELGIETVEGADRVEGWCEDVSLRKRAKKRDIKRKLRDGNTDYRRNKKK